MHSCFTRAGRLWLADIFRLVDVVGTVCDKQGLTFNNAQLMYG